MMLNFKYLASSWVFLVLTTAAFAANSVLNYTPSGTSGMRVTNDPNNAAGFVGNQILCDASGHPRLQMQQNARASQTIALVDPSGVTPPVSAAALPLPTNAAQETGGNLATVAGAVTGSVVQNNVKQINGVTPLMGNARRAPGLSV